ncbi:MAG TPA: MFS transporter [Acetobacteraceae bacterium]|nr:MFS transporter [Acetobacteraceae bacterium]
MSFTAPAGRFTPAPRAEPRRILAVACGVHALHDGFTDLIYVLLPVWQAEFALSYATLGVLRMVFAGAMAGLQVPVSLLTKRLGGPLLLALGTATAGGAYLAIGVTGAGFAVLVTALLIGGTGAATQHPIGSSLVAAAYAERGARGPLGTYNFAGDLGKMALPAATAWMLGIMPWRSALGAIGTLGLLTAVLIVLLLPNNIRMTAAPEPEQTSSGAVPASPRQRHGFPILFLIGVLDSGTRMGFLAFLPFVLKAKGADTPMIGIALTLIFAGGAAGKLACGWLGARIGVLRTVFVTELGTALGIALLAQSPLAVGLACLPLIGIALNGTSSVLYGTVPELVAFDRHEQAFGLFYTGTIGGGAIAPALYGFVGDAIGPTHAVFVVAAVCLLTLPLAWALQPSLSRAR